ncbi:FtsX-like permease family protein [Agromyces cerinus]|uniref:Putative ABC transport system permease protein n=1 Tax=Agromyces cerinus subsp. cerinus TaxID=232089 RepID=A0A1N6FHQ6_9MICO|nr:FtsX-like permease family protein [Agromyces cerinus]SIN94767.1 putative ABC transport system permease protein [Agromyces cerinus subsp. cerinus]
MTDTRHSRLSAAGLLRRQFFAGPVASIMLSLLVLAGALLATGVPRAVAAMHTAALEDSLEQFPGREIDLVTSSRNLPELGAASGDTTLEPEIEAVWGAQEQRLLDIRAGMPELLTHVTGEPLTALVAGPTNAGSEGSTTYQLFTAYDPRIREHIELTGGEWPAPLTGPVPGGAPLEIVLADEVAEQMGWETGVDRSIPIGTDPQDVRLVGTFAAIDPHDGFWTHVPSVALEPAVAYTPEGNIEVTGLGFADPVSWAALEESKLPTAMDAWYPVIPERIRAADSAELVTQLGEFTSQVFVLGSGSWEYWFATVGEVAFTSGLTDALGDAAVAASASDAVLATIASGPIGVMVAVLVLGARVVFERRRTGLELAAARGASPGQLRGILALEGLAIGLPAAIVGGLLGTVLVPADAGAGGWTIAALFALTPMVLLIAAEPGLSPLRRARADLGRPSTGRFRWIAEALVTVLAVTAVVLLYRRGLATSTATTGVDPLLAAVPLLLSLLACLVVLRVYPIPLAALVRRTSRRAGLVPFLGSARALRDPSAGIVPVLAVVVGVSVTVFSSVLLGTVQAGVDRAADAQVGADASVAGTPFTLEQLDEFAAVPGVAAIAPVYSAKPTKVTADGRARTSTLIVVDAEQMRRVQQGRAAPTQLPEGLGETDTEDVPVLLSKPVADFVADADSADLDGEDFDVLGVVDGRTAYSPRSNWVLMDVANAKPFTATLVPRTVLVRFEPGTSAADADEITAALAEIAGENAVVVTPEDLLAELRERPTTQGLVISLVVAIVLASLLTALAIVLTLVVGRPARDRLLPLLSTLGLGRRGERALVVWEIGPVAVIALVAGALLGIALPFVVLAGIDLRAFTDGDAQPAVTLDPWLIIAVLAGSMLVTIAAAVAASRIDGSVNAARAMRKEEEG